MSGGLEPGTAGAVSSRSLNFKGLLPILRLLDLLRKAFVHKLASKHGFYDRTDGIFSDYRNISFGL